MIVNQRVSILIDLQSSLTFAAPKIVVSCKHKIVMHDVLSLVQQG